MEEITNHSWLFWISAVSAVTLVGISKAAFGTGVGVIATPLLALTIPVAEAAALLLPLLIICDIIAVWSYGSHFDRRSVKLLLPGAFLGIGAASCFFGFFMGVDRILRIGVGILALAFVTFQIVRAHIFGALKKRHPHSVEGLFWGAFSGFTSTLVHAGGPPLAVYLIPLGLPVGVYVGTTVVFFAVTNAIKLIPYWGLGMLNAGNFTTIALLSPLTYVGVRLGFYLNGRFSKKWFDRIIYGFLLVSGLELLGVSKTLISLFK